jgi:hypothetical protein
MTIMDFVDPDKSNDVNKGLNGESDFDNDGADNAMKDMMDSTQAKNMLDDTMQKAQELCNDLDKNMDEQVQEQMFENANKTGEDSTAGKLTPDYLKEVAAKLENINLSMGPLKEKIKKLLDKSVSYFSSNEKTEYEDLFNSDNIAGLEDYELLHPKLRKLFVEDLQVKNTKKVGKIDIYMDVSGSMSSSCGINNEKGDRISKMDFCKAFAAKLKQMDMLNEIYKFDTKVTKSKNDVISISMINCNGGTDIDKAIMSIDKNGVNALIITDAEDNCQIYSDKAFFIGVEGSRFTSFEKETIKKYSEKFQVVIFDGKSIKKVDETGRVL